MKSGLYTLPNHAPPVNWKVYVDWLHALGVKIVEFWAWPDEDFEREETRVERMREVIKYAHSKEMETYVLLSTNCIVTKKGEWVHLCPRSRENFERTTKVTKHYVEKYRDADAFEVIAGDPGGCQCGKCDWRNYLDYAKEYYSVLKDLNSKSEFYLNMWAVSYWHKPEGRTPVWQEDLGYIFQKAEDAYWREVFDYEDTYSKKVIEALPSLPDDVYVSLTANHLYRPLSFAGYKPEDIPEWPVKSTIDEIHKMGRKILIWPFFLLDDDASRKDYWMKIHSTVGYIKELMLKLQKIGVDTVIPGLCTPKLQLLNTYAFACLSKNPSLKVTTVLRDFSKLFTQKEDVERLYNILLLLENHDEWFGGGTMPKQRRIKHPEPKLSWKQALKEVKRIQPIETPAIPMVDTPKSFLKNLEATVATHT